MGVLNLFILKLISVEVSLGVTKFSMWNLCVSVHKFNYNCCNKILLKKTTRKKNLRII